jgi:4'-phosphopantetheinyl transferase
MRDLSQPEQELAQRYEFLRRSDFVIARSALRRILGRRIGVEPADVPVEISATGKPSLRACALHFSVAHTRGLALIGVNTAGEIGVDVELLRDVPHAERIAARLFTADERAAIRQKSSAAAAETFLRRWTAGEAVLKTRGDTLDSWPRIPLEACAGSEVEVENGSRFPVWVRTVRPAPGYIGAVAMTKPGLPLRFHSYAAAADL